MAPLPVIPNPLKRTIRQTVSRFRMLQQNDTVLIAVSGGPDSVALARILLDMQEEYHLTLGLAHLNHLLREEESKRDEHFVKQFARSVDLPLFSDRQDTKAHAKKNRLSIETAGRDLRYAFFKKIALTHGYTKVATGHTGDDNAELVLMNLLRGSGARGLSGIPPVREGCYIRPMIELTKAQVYDLLKEMNQSFIIDSSNADPAYLRNRVRNRLIPLLQSEYNPEIADALNRMSNVLRQEDDFLDIRTQSDFDQCLLNRKKGSLVLSKKRLSRLHPAVLRRVLRRAIQDIQTNLNRISLVHLENIIDFCFQRNSGTSLDLPNRIRIYKTANHIEIKREKQPLREMGRREKQLRQQQSNLQGKDE